MASLSARLSLAALVLTVTLPLAAPAQQWNGTVITANEQGHSISIVDAVSWRVRSTLHLRVMPHNVQASSDGRFLYVTGMIEMPDMPGMVMDTMPGVLLAFDLRNPQRGALFSIPLGVHPAHVIVDRENRFAYVTMSGENAVKVIDIRRRIIVATIRLGKTPHGLRFLPGEHVIAVAEMGAGTVSFIGVAQRQVIATVAAGKTPVQVASAPDGKTVYATVAGDNAVAVIDVATHARIKLIQVGPNPMQLYASPDGKSIYVAGQGTEAVPGHTLSIIDTASQEVRATIQVPAGAHGVVVTPDSSKIYVTDAFDSMLTEIDARTLSVRSITVDEAPNGVTLGM